MSHDLVNVAVPRIHLSKVYGFIAHLEGKPVASEAPEPEAWQAEAAADLEWTPARIRTMVDQSDKAMRSVLKALASRPGEWLSTEVLAEAVSGSANSNTIAGTLGAFGRRCKSRYGLETKPYERKYEHGVGKVYRMSKQIAQQVLKALEKAE